MQIIFSKNKLKNKYLYNLETIIDPNNLLKSLNGSIYIGKMNLVELNDRDDASLYYIGNGKVIGMFHRKFGEKKYEPIEKIENEEIQIILKDGENLTDQYTQLFKEIVQLEENSEKIKNKEQLEQLKKQLQIIQTEKKYFNESGTVSDYDYLEDVIQELNKLEKNKLKRILFSSIGFLGTIGIIVFCIQKFKGCKK